MRVESSNLEIVPARVLPQQDGSFVVGPCRAAYVFLKKGKVEELAGQPPRTKFTMNGLLPPGSDFKALWDVAEKEIRLKMGEKLRQMGGNIPESVRRGIRFVDREPNYIGKHGFHPGWGFINFVTYDTAPGVVDAGNPPQRIDPGEVIPGYWVRVRTRPFFYSNKANIGISWGLNAVQLGMKDQRLDNRVDAEAAFGTWEMDGTMGEPMPHVISGVPPTGPATAAPVKAPMPWE